MERIEFVNIDQDILDFLKVTYFGSIIDPMAAASDRAYRDFNRTIRFNKMPQSERSNLRKFVTDMFRREIPLVANAAVMTQESYDKWHHNVCKTIRDTYRAAGVEFYYGQAQKWINMTMKYLYVIGEYTFDVLFPYLHIPVDNFIFIAAEEELSVAQPKVRWSRWDNYDQQYMAYQTSLRKNIRNNMPLRWEFKYWMKAARRLERSNDE